jgi:WD40 repeat protein
MPGRSKQQAVPERAVRREGVLVLAAVGIILAALGGIALWWSAWAPRAVLSGAGGLVSLAFTPDGKVFATDGFSAITLWDTATGVERAAWPHSTGGGAGMAAFSSDGSALATINFHGPGSPISIELHDVLSGKDRWSVPTPNEGAFAILFAAEGKHVRTVLGVPGRGSSRGPNGAEVIDIDAATGREVSRRGFTIPGPTGGSAISPDGRLMALPSGTAVVLWNLETDSEQAAPTISAAGRTVSAVRFAPASTALAVGMNDGSVEIWDLPALKLRATFPCHGTGIRSIALRFSADGSTLASWGQLSANASMLATALQYARLVSAPSSTGAHEVVVLDVATGDCLGRLRAVAHPYLSPDGRTLAVEDASFAVKLFDLPARKAKR